MKLVYSESILFVALFFISSLFPQTLDETEMLYDDSEVAIVKITVDPAIIEWLYQDENLTSDSLHYAQFYFKNKWIEETVDSIGFRLRGNTSRFSEKKSFKVSFNYFIPGREFYGVDKLNLNGEHNDPSIIRSKLCWDQYQNIGMRSSKAAHTEVYLNDQYYGLYISVEHIDDEFLQKYFNDDSGNLWKCLWPADLNYLGSDPDLYKEVNDGNGRQAYELKTNENENDYYQLARLIDIINNTPNNLFADSVESIIYIYEVLKYFSVNNLTGSWDDYWSLMNNYYLYHEPSVNMFHFIPYDYDNTYGIDWFNIDWVNADPYNFPKVSSGYRPLAERIMQNDQYRDLYTHFLEFHRNNVFLLTNWDDRIDSLRIMITNSALLDTFRTKDYDFTSSDFFNSYSSSNYSNQHVKYGLKQFINLRNESLPNQLSYLNAAPIAYKIDWLPKIPGPNDSVFVTVSAFSSVGMDEVSIHFTPEGSATEIYPMNFSPVAQTKIVEETDRWVGVIPPLGNGNSGSFQILVKDDNGQSQLYPRTKSIEIIVPGIIEDDVIINEFLADNENSNPDPAGEFDDWLELYNPTSEPVLLTGRYLTDKPDNLIKWQFTDDSLFINPGEFLIVWCDEDEEQDGIHTNFKLSANGEFIGFTETDGVTIIDSISFGEQNTDISFGRFPDASDNWQFLSPTPGSNNILSGIEDELIPTDFKIAAYPNPFNPSTTIQYQIPLRADVKIKIYDLLGRSIWQKDEGVQEAGTYELRWNGINQTGTKVTSGIYLLRVEADNLIKTHKLMLLK